MMYELDLTPEERDTVVVALRDAARSTIEAKTPPYTGATLDAYLDGIDAILRKLLAKEVERP